MAASVPALSRYGHMTSIVIELKDYQMRTVDSLFAVVCLVCEAICLARVKMQCEEDGVNITVQRSFW
jgi:phosphatidylserine synthase